MATVSIPLMDNWEAAIRRGDEACSQPELFPLTLTGVFPDAPQGNHIKFAGDVGGERYYCKDDSCGLPIRATEWFCTSLARVIGIAVPDFTAILSPRDGDTLFGSKAVWGTAPRVEVETFLTTQGIGDPAITGRSFPWLTSYLSRLYAYDLFISNPDRQLCNFLLVPRGSEKILLAFDFASADLRQLGDTKFRIAQTETMRVGRALRKLHKFDALSANDMLTSIESVSAEKIEHILLSMPDGWLDDEAKGRIRDHWSGGNVEGRLAAIRNGISDGTLL